jgi:hypothetical protein
MGRGNLQHSFQLLVAQLLCTSLGNCQQNISMFRSGQRLVCVCVCGGGGGSCVGDWACTSVYPKVSGLSHNEI